MTPAKRLKNILESAAYAVTDDTGRFHSKEFREEIARRLQEVGPHVEAHLSDKQLKSLERGFRQSRKPKIDDRLSLFRPDAVLSLGNGISVWMGRATPDDLRTWGSISSRNRRAVDEADNRTQDYVNSRIDAWRDRKNCLLMDLEQRDFGWQPSEDDSEWGDSDFPADDDA